MCNLSQGVWNEGKKEGIEIGEAKGIRQSSIETARYLLSGTDWNNQKISEAVSGQLTPEEVDKLRKGIRLS